MQYLFKNPKEMNDDEKMLLALCRLQYILEGYNLKSIYQNYDMTETSVAHQKAKFYLEAIKNIEELKNVKNDEDNISYPNKVGFETEIHPDITRIKKLTDINNQLIISKKELDMFIGKKKEKTNGENTNEQQIKKEAKKKKI